MSSFKNFKIHLNNKFISPTTILTKCLIFQIYNNYIKHHKFYKHLDLFNFKFLLKPDS